MVPKHKNNYINSDIPKTSKKVKAINIKKKNISYAEYEPILSVINFHYSLLLYYPILLVFVVNFILCLIYKLNFILSKYT